MSFIVKHSSKELISHTGMLSPIEILLLFIGGALAGIINTLAGNGSAITLSLLIFIGMPATVANATNRIGALVQTITAVFSLRRTSRTRLMFQDSYWFFLPSVLGSIIGAVVALYIDAETLRYVIGLFMLLLLFTLINNPSKWLRGTDRSNSHKNATNWTLIFLSAIYAGFIQMGMGIILLAILVLISSYSLRDANIIKLVLSVVFVIPAFFIFLWSGDMLWIPGLVLAAGQAVGAVLGARYVLFMPKANTYVRWLLIFILAVSSLTLLDIPKLLNFA